MQEWLKRKNTEDEMGYFCDEDTNTFVKCKVQDIPEFISWNNTITFFDQDSDITLTRKDFEYNVDVDEKYHYHFKNIEQFRVWFNQYVNMNENYLNTKLNINDSGYDTIQELFNKGVLTTI